MGEAGNRNLIEMEETIDPITGETVFQVLNTFDDVAIRNGELVPLSEAHGDGHNGEPRAEQPSVKLTCERFAAGPPDDPWATAEHQQNAGQEARIVNGQLVFGPAGEAPENSVKLTEERFATLSAVEVSQVQRLAASGSASAFIRTLTPTSDLSEYFKSDPGGLYLHTKPSHHGDELHAVILRDASTRLYHAHLWQFMKREGNDLKRADLNRWVGSAPNMSAHRLHLYPGAGRHGAVLCLSERSRGGVPDLTTCVMQAAKWAAGMGEVVRGRPFPYRQQGDG